MLTRLCFALMWSVASVLPAAAGPVQGVIDSATGAVEVRGYTDEIWIAFESRVDIWQNPPIWVGLEPPRKYIIAVEPFKPGIIQPGIIHLGQVFKPGLSFAQLSDINFEYQTSFVSPISSPPPTFVPNLAAIPAGQEGFYIVGIPEPSSLAIAVLALSACTVAGFRRR